MTPRDCSRDLWTFGKTICALLIAFLSPTAEAGTWLVPGVAHTQGANGTSFISDLSVTNTGSEPANVTIRFIPSGDAAPPAPRTVSVPEKATVNFPDLLSTIWGITNGGGAVELSAEARLIVRARTFNATPAGSYGLSLPILRRSDLLDPGSTGHVGWVSQSLDRSRGFRTNVGLTFPESEGGSASVRLFSADGMLLGTREYSFPRATFIQEPLTAWTTHDLPIGRIEVLTRRGVVAAYSALVDNVTGDSSVFPAGHLKTGETDLVLSGIARAPGANGTFFRSDLVLSNPSVSAVTLTVSLLQPGVENRSPFSSTVSLAPRSTREIRDVLFVLFGSVPGTTAALRIRSDFSFIALARTSNVDPVGRTEGTFGSQQLPVAYREMSTPRDAGGLTVTSIVQNAQFRTNIGFTSGSDGASLTLVMRSGEGVILGERSTSLSAWSWFQVNAGVLLSGIQIPDGSSLEVIVLAGSVAVYSSTIDQLSGDASVTPARTTATCDPLPFMVIPLSVCPGARATAALNIEGAAAIDWTISGAAILSGQGTTTIDFVAGLSGSVTVIASVTRNGCTLSQSRSIPIAENVSIRQVQATATIVRQPVTIRWEIDGPVVQVTISGTDFPSPLTVPASPGTYTYVPSLAGFKSFTVRATGNCGVASMNGTYTVTSADGQLGPGSGGSGGSFPGVFTMPGALGQSYVVYVPRSYRPAEPARLVYALGGQGAPAEITLMVGWQAVAETDNVIIVTLTPRSSGPGYSGAYEVPEINTIAKAMDEVPRRYNIAIRHISLWGFSAGGHLSYALGLAAGLSQQLNGIAIQAGAIEAAATRWTPPSWPPQQAARRVPIYISCGTLDTVGSGGGLIGALRRNSQMLAMAGYPVVSREVEGQGHTYTENDVLEAWKFLKAQRL